MENQTNDRLVTYRIEAECVLPSGEAALLRENRTWLATLTLTTSEQRDLKELDEMVMEIILDHDDLQPYLLENDKAHPLTQWWWHLSKLRAGTYPAHLLPLHLQEIYQPVEQRLAA